MFTVVRRLGLAFLLVPLLLLDLTAVYADDGDVEEIVSPPHTEMWTIDSHATGRHSPYLVYLPPGYETNTWRYYPTLYMLHGLGGNYPSGEYWEWSDLRFLVYADQMIRSGEIEPMIIIQPQGEDGYWVDQADDGPQWGQFLAWELVPVIDYNYRTLADRAHRGVGGLSMGGHGALQLAMNYPDTFGVVGAHSPTFRSQDTAPYYFGDVHYFKAHDPIHLVQSKTATVKTLSIWLDVGYQDEIWQPAIKQFARIMNDYGIPFTFRQFDGEHHGDYWTATGPEYLRFYSNALK